MSAALSLRRPLRIVHLFPKSMGLYGDRGNAMALRHRCERRGIPVEMAALESVRGLSFEEADIVLLGGGADKDQERVAQKLAELDRDAFVEAIEDGLVVLAVCGGYQFLGISYTTAGGKSIPGLRILPVVTTSGLGPRLIGNIAVRVPKELGGIIVGFENHGGRTWILGHSAKPLGYVAVGRGNNGIDATEGCRLLNCFGTYLHGPVLPANPQFTDYLVCLAVARAIKIDPTEAASLLPPLDSRFEVAARHRALVGMSRPKSFAARLGIEF